MNKINTAFLIVIVLTATFVAGLVIGRWTSTSLSGSAPASAHEGSTNPAAFDEPMVGGETQLAADASSAIPADAAPQFGEQGDEPITLNSTAWPVSRAQWIHLSQPLGTVYYGAPAIVQHPVKHAPAHWPVQGGVPLPSGEVRDLQHLNLVDESGASVPFQARPLAHWPDGSVKWVLVQTQGRHGERMQLDFGEVVQRPEHPSLLSIRDDSMRITIETGPMRLAITKQPFSLIDELWLDVDGNGAIDSTERLVGAGDIVTRFRGTSYRASLDRESVQVEVEEQGPVQVTVKATGWCRRPDGSGFGRFVVRLSAFAGQPFVRIHHTFIYTGFPANPHDDRNQGLSLPDNERVEAIELVWQVEPGADAIGRLGDRGGIYEASDDVPLTLFQNTADSFTVRRGEETVGEGQRTAGWMDLSGHRGGVTVALRDSWQQFPKQFEVSRGVLRLGLWPAAAGPLDLQTTAASNGPEALARGSAYGLAKTHEVWLLAHGSTTIPEQLQLFAESVSEPALVKADPEWIFASGAVGALAPRSRHVGAIQAEGLMDDMFDWSARQQQVHDKYGMLNFGDTLSRRRTDEDDATFARHGSHPEGRWGWYNHTSALLQYARTGLWSYFQFGEDLARHIMDVDTCHYDTVGNDPRLRGVISDDMSQVGSMHRHTANHWVGQNDETTHTNIVGLLLYYYFTGYERALDVAIEAGRFLDQGRITSSGRADAAPQRAIANIIWGHSLLYEATHDRTYLESAGQWMQLLVAGQREDGSWPAWYNPLNDTWYGDSQSMLQPHYTLPALVAYHRQTDDPTVAKAILRGTMYAMAGGNQQPYAEVLSYAYRLTGDQEYVLFTEQFVQRIVEGRHRDGMVFEQAIYHRPNHFLYQFPYAVALLEGRDDFVASQDQHMGNGASR